MSTTQMSKVAKLAFLKRCRFSLQELDGQVVARLYSTIAEPIPEPVRFKVLSTSYNGRVMVMTGDLAGYEFLSKHCMEETTPRQRITTTRLLRELKAGIWKPTPVAVSQPPFPEDVVAELKQKVIAAVETAKTNQVIDPGFPLFPNPWDLTDVIATQEVKQFPIKMLTGTPDPLALPAAKSFNDMTVKELQAFLKAHNVKSINGKAVVKYRKPDLIRAAEQISQSQAA